jgi:excisionase family DNA binding protein
MATRRSSENAVYSARHRPGVGGGLTPYALGLRRAAYSVNETLEILSIGRTQLYELVKEYRLRPVKLGKKTLFFADDIADFLAELRAN